MLGPHLLAAQAAAVPGETNLADFFLALVGCSTDAINFAAVSHSGLEKTTAMWNNLKGTSDIYATKDPSGIPLNELADMAFGKWRGQKNSAPLWNLIKQYEAAVDDSDERRRVDQAEIQRLRDIIARLPVELTPSDD